MATPASPPAVGEPHHATTRRAVCAALCVVILLGFAALWSRNLATAYAPDYDEGVYLLSAREVVRGHAIGSEVFSSQPPGFVEMLASSFRLFGDSRATGRYTIMACALLGLAAVGVVAWQIGGPVAAPVAMVVLGLSEPYFIVARAVWAEAPALALATGALACVIADRRRPSILWLALGALLWGAALMMKLLVAVWALPIAVLFFLHRPGGAGEAWAFTSSPKDAARGAGRLAGMTLLTVALLAVYLLRFEVRPLLEQVVGFHLSAGEQVPLSPAINVRLLVVRFITHPAATALGLAGLWGLWRTNRAAAVWLGVWLGASVAFLLWHHPLYLHHMALLMPPMAVVAGCGGAAMLAFWRSPGHRPLAAAALLIILLGHPVENNLATMNEPVPPLDGQVMDLIAQHTAADDRVISDWPFMVYATGRRTPTGMVDTSLTRIRSGSLTSDEAIAASADAAMIVFWSDRLRKLQGYRAWVEAHYDVLARFEQPPVYNGVVYRRRAGEQ